MKFIRLAKRWIFGRKQARRSRFERMIWWIVARLPRNEWGRPAGWSEMQRREWSGAFPFGICDNYPRPGAGD